MTAPWDKNPTTPEAKALVARDRAERNLDRSFPRKPWHSAYFSAWGVAAILGLIVSVAGLLFWAWGSPFGG